MANEGTPFFFFLILVDAATRMSQLAVLGEELED